MEGALGTKGILLVGNLNHDFPDLMINMIIEIAKTDRITQFPFITTTTLQSLNPSNTNLSPPNSI